MGHSVSNSRPDYELDVPSTPATTNGPRSRPGPSGGRWVARAWAVLLCVLHGVAAWIGVGGRDGMANEWPILSSDHGFHYHHGLMTRHFLRTTGMSAGYDPSFMSGYPMSVITGTSSTLTNLVILAFGGDRPALAFKVMTFACLAALPWLLLLAGVVLGSGPVANLSSILLFLAYFWTDFPVVFAGTGMTAYMLSVPLGLLTIALLTAYLDRGGFASWLAAAAASVVLFLVHLTSAMVVGPAGFLAYLIAVVRARRDGRSFPLSRHIGLVAIVPVMLALNAFWLLPGYWLASTAGVSDFIFVHQGSVLKRVGEIFWNEAPIESVALALGLIGVATLAYRAPVAATGLGGVLVIGFGWGYLAGASRSLDSLQPGRHTYACFTAACLAGGVGLAEILSRLRSSRLGRLDHVAAIALAMVGVRIFGPSMVESLRMRIGRPESFLSSQLTPRLRRLIDEIRKHVEPGERLLFEETGFDNENLGDPFGGRHLSPILPHVAGVEVLGGPYLHTPVTTNFTQFGENRLFGKKDWDRDFFVRHARLYRPAAICCWSPKARGFCLANPDLIRVVSDDGTILIGRVIGFEGATIRGSARVEAGPNRLVVRDAVADADGLVVLRYHAAPYLTVDPPASIEPILLEDDPVPFIGLRPSTGPVTIRMSLPPHAPSKR